MTPRSLPAVFFFATFLAFANGACSGTGGSGVGSSAAPGADVTGKWAGRVVSQTGFEATFTSDLVQTGAAVDGSTRTSGGCIGGGKVSGAISGDELTVTLTAGEVRVDFRLTVSSADQLDGTYELPPAGGCPADRGSVSMTRTR